MPEKFSKGRVSGKTFYCREGCYSQTLFKDLVRAKNFPALGTGERPRREGRKDKVRKILKIA